MNSNANNIKQIMAYRDSITILEFVKEYQQDVIAELEYITGIDLAKKMLPKTLADEIYNKKVLLIKKKLKLK